MSQTAQFDKGINLFCLVFLTLKWVTLNYGVPHWGTSLVYLYNVVSGQSKDFLSMYNISFVNFEFNMHWLKYIQYKISIQQGLIFRRHVYFSCLPR